MAVEKGCQSKDYASQQLKLNLGGGGHIAHSQLCEKSSRRIRLSFWNVECIARDYEPLKNTII